MATRLGVKKSAVASVLAMRTGVVPGPKDSWQIITWEALPGNVLKASITTCASLKEVYPKGCLCVRFAVENCVELHKS